MTSVDCACALAAQEATLLGCLSARVRNLKRERVRRYHQRHQFSWAKVHDHGTCTLIEEEAVAGEKDGVSAGGQKVL